MQCARLLKKRSLELEPWSFRAKRVCLEAELLPTECEMETSHTFTVASNQQQGHWVVPVQSRPPLLHCPRCLAGEPGHINHIMGL